MKRPGTWVTNDLLKSLEGDATLAIVFAQAAWIQARFKGPWRASSDWWERRTGLSRRRTNRALQSLAKLGWIELTKIEGDRVTWVEVHEQEIELFDSAPLLEILGVMSTPSKGKRAPGISSDSLQISVQNAQSAAGPTVQNAQSSVRNAPGSVQNAQSSVRNAPSTPISVLKAEKEESSKQDARGREAAAATPPSGEKEKKPTEEDRERAGEIRLRESLAAGTYVHNERGFVLRLKETLGDAEVTAILAREHRPKVDLAARELARSSRSTQTKVKRDAEKARLEARIERERLEDLCAQEWLKTASPADHDGALSKAQELCPRNPKSALADALHALGVDLAGFVAGHGGEASSHTDAFSDALWPSKGLARPLGQTEHRSASREALTSKGESA